MEATVFKIPQQMATTLVESDGTSRETIQSQINYLIDKGYQIQQIVPLNRLGHRERVLVLMMTPRVPVE